MGEKPGARLLSKYLDTRKGNCVSMPTLFHSLMERVDPDVPFHGVRAPMHLFCRYRDRQDGQVWNVEATNGGNSMRDRWAIEQFSISPVSIDSGVYMRDMTKREYIAELIGGPVTIYRQQEQYQKALELTEVMLVLNPISVSGLVHEGAISACLGYNLEKALATSGRRATPDEEAKIKLYRGDSNKYIDRATILRWHPVFAVLLFLLPLVANAKWISVDPNASKYPSMSPYVYGNNNPLQFVDPNGKDSYLSTWAPAGGQVGHSAIGTDIRDALGNQTGQIEVRELWPSSTIDKDHTTAPADYMKSDPINTSDIGTFQSLEGRAADAIVKIGGGVEQDAAVNAALDNAATNPTYDAKTNNCTNFTQAGVQATGINPGSGAGIQVSIYRVTFTVANNVATPVSLNNAVVGSQNQRVTTVRELPANQQNPNLIVKQR